VCQSALIRQENGFIAPIYLLNAHAKFKLVARVLVYRRWFQVQRLSVNTTRQVILRQRWALVWGVGLISYQYYIMRVFFLD
ncbi:hypothetical protein O6383_24165, partial [Salmonella enterica subsp. enterica]